MSQRQLNLSNSRLGAQWALKVESRLQWNLKLSRGFGNKAKPTCQANRLHQDKNHHHSRRASEFNLWPSYKDANGDVIAKGAGE
jgi:hypothetical protein